MKAILMHPYRHHSYNLVKAMVKSSLDVKACYGYYNKNSYFYKLIEKYNKDNKVISKFLGYNDLEIDNYVEKDILSYYLFLLSKLDNKKTDLFIKNFDKSCKKKIVDFDAVFFLQDYCQESFDEAYKQEKFIIYDHILPAGYQQRNLLEKECEIMGFDKIYVDKFLPLQKIEKNYENISKANLVLNASMSTFNITKEIEGNHESVIIPYGSNFDNFDKTSFAEYINIKLDNIEKRKLKILYVGSISLAKGIRVLINIIEEIPSIEVEFGIVGVPNKEEDKILIQKLKSFENVKYYGSVPHRQISQIYEQYDLFIFTSIIEGFGMVTLEAMSKGLPCIVNKYCSSVITSGYNGFIVEEYSSKAYVEVLKCILNNKQCLYELATNAYHTSIKYNWEKYQQELSLLLKRAVIK